MIDLIVNGGQVTAADAVISPGGRPALRLITDSAIPGPAVYVEPVEPSPGVGASIWWTADAVWWEWDDGEKGGETRLTMIGEPFGD